MQKLCVYGMLILLLGCTTTGEDIVATTEPSFPIPAYNAETEKAAMQEVKYVNALNASMQASQEQSDDAPVSTH